MVNSTPYCVVLRLPDAFVVGPAERAAENFCLKLSMIFGPCPWGKLSIRLSRLLSRLGAEYEIQVPSNDNRWYCSPGNWQLARRLFRCHDHLDLFIIGAVPHQ
jgi:hypothetical protein